MDEYGARKNDTAATPCRLTRLASRGGQIAVGGADGFATACGLLDAAGFTRGLGPPGAATCPSRFPE